MSMNPQSFLFESVPGATLLPTQAFKRFSLAQQSEERPGWWTVIVQAAEVIQDNSAPRATVPRVNLNGPAGSSVYLEIAVTGSVAAASCEHGKRAGFSLVTDCIGRWSVWGDSVDLTVLGVGLDRVNPGDLPRSTSATTAYTFVVASLYPHMGRPGKRRLIPRYASPIGDRHARVSGRAFVDKTLPSIDLPLPQWAVNVQVSTPAAAAASVEVVDAFGVLSSFPIVAGSSAVVRLPPFALALRLPRIGGADTRYSLVWGQEWW